MKQKVMFLWTVLVCFTGLLAINVQAQTICTNESGTHDGYYYELWNSGGGDACMTLKEGGAFSCQWSDPPNVQFMKGLNFGKDLTHREIGDITVRYGADFQPDGNAYLGIYGWTMFVKGDDGWPPEPFREIYIIDSWGTWRPSGAKLKDTVTI
ncbi:MAG: glycoside hydrolase family 11 protein, partial [Desulfobacteraceae bacterium]